MDYRFYEELIDVKGSKKNVCKTKIYINTKRLKEILRENNVSIDKWAKLSGYKTSTLNSYLSGQQFSLHTAIKMFKNLCEDWELLLSSVEISHYEACYRPDRDEYYNRNFSKDKLFTRMYLSKLNKEQQKKSYQRFFLTTQLD